MGTELRFYQATVKLSWLYQVCEFALWIANGIDSIKWDKIYIIIIIIIIDFVVPGPLYRRGGTCRSSAGHSPKRDGKLRQSSRIPVMSLSRGRDRVWNGDVDYLQNKRGIPRQDYEHIFSCPISKGKASNSKILIFGGYLILTILAKRAKSAEIYFRQY